MLDMSMCRAMPGLGLSDLPDCNSACHCNSGQDGVQTEVGAVWRLHHTNSRASQSRVLHQQTGTAGRHIQQIIGLLLTWQLPSSAGIVRMVQPVHGAAKLMPMAGLSDRSVRMLQAYNRTRPCGRTSQIFSALPTPPRRGTSL